MLVQLSCAVLDSFGDRTYPAQSLPVVSVSSRADSMDLFHSDHAEDLGDGLVVGLAVELRRYCMSATGALQPKLCGKVKIVMYTSGNRFSSIFRHYYPRV
jgi:hypothetical protein